jgi:hypothetical protein
MKEVTQTLTSFLRQVGVVYGVHFTQLRDERTCRIVLECIPFSPTLERIQQKLQEVVREIPSRPPTASVKVDKPTVNARATPAR